MGKWGQHEDGDSSDTGGMGTVTGTGMDSKGGQRDKAV